QRGGGVVTLQDLGGDVFDSIVYGERQRARWIAAAQAVHPAILRDIGGDAEAIYAQVLAAKAEFKARSDQDVQAND
ncbi:MAG: hypothetical protein HN793_13430, partial [Rhodospirillaceae bacterium]|nr:hypothetical protein [Rhodospirillaceae bacterium]